MKVNRVSLEPVETSHERRQLGASLRGVDKVRRLVRHTYL